MTMNLTRDELLKQAMVLMVNLSRRVASLEYAEMEHPRATLDRQQQDWQEAVNAWLDDFNEVTKSAAPDGSEDILRVGQRIRFLPDAGDPYTGSQTQYIVRGVSRDGLTVLHRTRYVYGADASSTTDLLCFHSWHAIGAIARDGTDYDW